MSTSFDVSFPIFMGLGLATVVAFVVAIRIQSIAWENPDRQISAALAMTVPIVLLCGTGFSLAWRIRRVYRTGRVVPGTVISKRVTWRRTLAVRVAYELGTKTYHRTVHLIRQPRTERLEPGRAVELILPRDRFPLWALIKEVYD